MTKPILFNTEMVRAILDGRKTVTRRVVNHKHLRGLENLSAEKIQRACVVPYRPGDILYVRETWAKSADWYDDLVPRYEYKADHPDSDGWGWRPSIHMPREAARIFLRVTDVRVERLQEIKEDGAQAEGLRVGWSSTPKSSKSCSARQAFMWIWDSTIKPADRERYGWAANPWVWVIAFERCKKPEEVRLDR